MFYFDTEIQIEYSVGMFKRVIISHYRNLKSMEKASVLFGEAVVGIERSGSRLGMT